MSSGYLLDTNVLSELRRASPNRGVTTFIEYIHRDALYVSVLTLGDLRKGIATMRRTDEAMARSLEAWVDTIESSFSDRIVEIDVRIARLWGELSADRTRPVVDTLIAATALAFDMTLVTRNVKDVADTGVPVLNPWEDS